MYGVRCKQVPMGKIYRYSDHPRSSYSLRLIVRYLLNKRKTNFFNIFSLHYLLSLPNFSSYQVGTYQEYFLKIENNPNVPRNGTFSRNIYLGRNTQVLMFIMKIAVDCRKVDKYIRTRCVVCSSNIFRSIFPFH